MLEIPSTDLLLNKNAKNEKMRLLWKTQQTESLRRICSFYVPLKALNSKGFFY